MHRTPARSSFPESARVPARWGCGLLAGLVEALEHPSNRHCEMSTTLLDMPSARGRWPAGGERPRWLGQRTPSDSPLPPPSGSRHDQTPLAHAQGVHRRHRLAPHNAGPLLLVATCAGLPGCRHTNSDNADTPPLHCAQDRHKNRECARGPKTLQATRVFQQSPMG